MEISFEFIKNYIKDRESIYSLIDIRNLLERVIDYKEYYPERLLPEEYKKYKLTIKECNSLISICNRKIRNLSRVGE